MQVEIYSLECFKGTGKETLEKVPLGSDDLDMIEGLASECEVRIEDMPAEGTIEFTIRIQGPDAHCTSFIRGLQSEAFSVVSDRQ